MKQISFWFGGGIYLCCLATGCLVQAQVMPDTTLPGNSNVTTQGNNSTITGGTRAGNNLFHSFRQFSISTGSAVYFNNAPDVQNIINRVTGPSISNIDGILRANGTANLFLLNPNGIIFGPHASLKINGSFLASTASSLYFADGTQFDAIASQPTPLLTVSIPFGLQFGANPGRILIQGDGLGIRQPSGPIIDTTTGLHVQSNQTLALVGGELVLEGATLKTAGGRIELGSVAGPSLVTLTPIDKGWFLGYKGVQNFQNIQLSEQTAVDASGVGGGDVRVQGRQVTLTNGSRIEASTLMSEPGGTLAVTATEAVELVDTSIYDSPSGLYALVYSGASGAGGNITIETGRLSIRGVDVQIATDTFGPGNSGDLIIKTGQLSLQDGAQIDANTFGPGNAGALIVRAHNSVELSGEGDNPSGLFAQADQGSIGTGGKLTIETGRLSIQNGAQITVSTFGSGNAGDLLIRASESIELSGEGPQFTTGLFAATTKGSTGAGGNLKIETRRLSVRNGALVAVRSRGMGNAGNLFIDPDLVQLDRGTLTAETESGEGGNITIQGGSIQLRNNSLVSTKAGSIGNGGSITINAGTLVGLENSDIIANASNGKGGFIQIKTKGVFGLEPREQLTPESDITAFSQKSPELNGTVKINTLVDSPSQGLVTLPIKPVDITGQIAQGCPAGVGPRASKFVVTGRGGLPPDPTEALRSEPSLADLGATVQTQENRTSATTSSNPSSSNSPPLVEAQGWMTNTKGEVVLVAQVPTATLHIPWLAPTICQATNTTS